MKKTACFCDLCATGEGVARLAIARYWNEKGLEWHTCRKHLENVKEMDLKYEFFEFRGNVDVYE